MATHSETSLHVPDAHWFRRIADISANLVFIYRFNPRGYVYVSPSAEPLVGYRPEEFYADPLLGHRLVHPHDAAVVEGLLTAGESGRVELRVFHKDGRTLWFEQDHTIIRDDSGAPFAVHGVARNISPRKEAEQAIRDSEARYRALFQSHPQAMWVFDVETLKFLAVNEAAQSFYGYSEAEFLSMTVLDIRPAADRERLLANMATTTGPYASADWRHVKKTGETVDVLVTSREIDFGGRMARLAMVQDVSAQRRAEAESATLQHALLQAQKMDSVGRLAGGVAHDFNNLLTVMSGYASLLLEETASGTPIYAKIEEIAFAAARARELTSKLLIFSRKHPYEPRLIAVDHFVEQESRLLPRLIGEHISVQTILDGQDAFVRMDPSQLTQVIINLVVNARDAMPDGGTLTIRTSVVTLDAQQLAHHPGIRDGKYLRLAFADSGCGMSAEVQSHLFEPFFTTKKVGQGTGLGLATVYGLVQQSGGFIEVQTAPNAGTTMTVLLPVSPEMNVDADVEPQARVRGGAETILVVEDEDSVRLLTRTVLERLGYQPVEAAGPSQAIALISGGLRPQLIVTDVVMPQMNGRRMISEIQRITNGFQVLYVSGFAETGMTGASDLHADRAHFLAKPFNPEALARKVRQLLDAAAG